MKFKFYLFFCHDCTPYISVHEWAGIFFVLTEGTSTVPRVTGLLTAVSFRPMKERQLDHLLCIM